MTTRREVIAGGLAALGVPFIGKGEPVRSMLGANEPKGTESGWQNPYITDGLVAMWDGQWNASGGVHDASATVWKDIITGYDLDITSGTWGDKGLVGTATTECMATMTTVPQAFIDMVVADGCSIEAVATPLGYGTNIFSFSSSVWNIYGWGSSVIWYWFRIKTGPVNIQNRGTIGEPISFSGTTDSDKRARWYCNAELISGPATYADPSPDTNVHLNIKGIIHTCRIYSRTLDAEEIAYNFAVDQERFGIG